MAPRAHFAAERICRSTTHPYKDNAIPPNAVILVNQEVRNFARTTTKTKTEARKQVNSSLGSRLNMPMKTTAHPIATKIVPYSTFA